MSKDNVKQQKNKGPHRWKKGETGNPNGRPKKEYCISDWIRQKGDAKTKQDRTRFEELSEIVWSRALAGDIGFVNIILDRMEGKAIDRVITKTDDDDLIIL